MMPSSHIENASLPQKEIYRCLDMNTINLLMIAARDREKCHNDLSQTNDSKVGSVCECFLRAPRKNFAISANAS